MLGFVLVATPVLALVGVVQAPSEERRLDNADRDRGDVRTP
jgi:hypothetical protein